MSEPDEWVTVAEAAARLGTTIPRLRRILARPEYREQKREQERKTRTGTRTAAVVSVSILEDLARSLSTEPARNRNENDFEAKQEREQPRSVDDRQVLIDHLEAEVAFLRASLEAASVERAELRRLLLVEQQVVKKLTSGPAGAVVDPDLAEQSASDTETGPQASPEPRTDVLVPNATDVSPPPKGLENKSLWQKFVDALLLRD